MLLYNIDNKLVNGLPGKLIEIKDEKPVVDFPLVQKVVKLEKKTWTFYDEKNPDTVVASRTQFPVKPSFAITSHKAQGQTLAAGIVISGNEFIHGQLYVACSRFRTKAGLCLRGFDLEKLIHPPKSLKISIFLLML